MGDDAQKEPTSEIFFKFEKLGRMRREATIEGSTNANASVVMETSFSECVVWGAGRVKACPTMDTYSSFEAETNMLWKLEYCTLLGFESNADRTI